MKRRILFVDDEPNVLDGLTVIHDEVGRHFDPAVCVAFEESVKELGAIRTESRDEAFCPAEIGFTP